MSAKHAPGPWLLAASNSWRRIVTEFDTREVCVPTKQPDGHPDLHFPNPHDVQVMVAAPELLAALMALVERGTDSPQHLAAEAAIAKALGEQS